MLPSLQMAGAQRELKLLMPGCRQTPEVPTQPQERRKPLGDCSQMGSALLGSGSSVPQQQHPHEQHRRLGSCCQGLVLQSLHFFTLSVSPLPALASAESQTQARSFSPSSSLSYAKNPLADSHSRCTACFQHLFSPPGIPSPGLHPPALCWPQSSPRLQVPRLLSLGCHLLVFLCSNLIESTFCAFLSGLPAFSPVPGTASFLPPSLTGWQSLCLCCLFHLISSHCVSTSSSLIFKIDNVI